MKNRERSRYFQAVARAFLSRRGAPFFLSAKDLDLILAWENLGIPLGVVREGIEKAFENLRDRQAGKVKVLSLSFCQRCVLRAFDQYRERKVGRKKRVEPREDKRKKIKAEVQKFLNHLPPELNYLGGVFLEARKKFSESRLDEDALEAMDEKIEELLLANCPEKERIRVRQESLIEKSTLNREELERVLKIKLVKILRDRYKVPYLSLFYY